MAKIITVKCTRKYFDIELNKHVYKGEEIEVKPERAKVLIKEKVCELSTIK